MDSKVKITFSTEDTQGFVNYLSFLNTLEKEQFNVEEALNEGLSKENWVKVLHYLKKGKILVHPLEDGSTCRIDLTSVERKILEVIH